MGIITKSQGSRKVSSKGSRKGSTRAVSQVRRHDETRKETIRRIERLWHRLEATYDEDQQFVLSWEDIEADDGNDCARRGTAGEVLEWLLKELLVEPGVRWVVDDRPRLPGDSTVAVVHRPGEYHQGDQLVFYVRLA